MTLSAAALLGYTGTAAASLVALQLPQDPNLIAGAILLVGGAVSTVFAGGIAKLGKAIATWRREWIEAMAGTHLAELTELKRIHAECEKRGTDLHNQVLDLKAEMADQNARHEESMARMLTRNGEIERNLAGLCYDLLVASGHLRPPSSS